MRGDTLVLGVAAERSRRTGDRLGITGLVALGAVALSLPFGLLAGVKPLYAVAGVLAIIFCVIAFTDLVLGFAIFTAMTFLETLTSGSAASLDKVAGLVLLAAWVANRATASRARATTITAENQSLAIWLTVYLVLNAASAAWSTSGGAAISQAYRYTLDALLIPIAYSAVETRRDMVKIIVGFMVGAGFSVLYGFVHPAAGLAHQSGRLTGSLGEANQSATVLVACLAFSAGIWLIARRSPRLKTLIVVVVLLALIGLVATLSRSGLIAFGVVLVLATVLGGRWRKRATWSLVVIVAALAVYFFGFAGSRAHRVTSDQSSGRNDIWMVALRAWDAHPLLGVGAGNFEVVSHDYLEQPGLIVSANDFVYDPKVVHNIYLEQLVTLGPLGLILLLGIFTVAIRIGLKAAHIFERLGDPALELAARCWILALVAFLTADFFASELVDKQLWITLAIGPILLKLARAQESTAAHRDTVSQAPPTVLGLIAR